jgi:hypothetical protein
MSTSSLATAIWNKELKLSIKTFYTQAHVEVDLIDWSTEDLIAELQERDDYGELIDESIKAKALNAYYALTLKQPDKAAVLLRQLVEEITGRIL